MEPLLQQAVWYDKNVFMEHKIALEFSGIMVEVLNSKLMYQLIINIGLLM